ncbi:sugar transporter-domain-containing protein [Apiospora arundinis]|uniref:Sugar transporter-domain-containing protein n=1 Tax=Apiospora arundinis TaxID=335852 RepID=A0ABR2IVV2_9PEZI
MRNYPTTKGGRHNGRRRGNRRTHRSEVPDSLGLLSDPELREDALHFAQTQLKLTASPEDAELTKKLIRAAFVARDADTYDEVARGENSSVDGSLQVTLTEQEKEALITERDKLFSKNDIWRVTVAVCMAAFLQGHMQASLNSSSLYRELLGADSVAGGSSVETINAAWALGGLNAVPWFAAACLGCWIAPPVNDFFGRKGAIALSASLILVSCVASGLIPVIQDENRRSDRYWILFGVRVVNGIGMGIKAVSTPILASETAIRFWRGSFLLAWQLWVAFGVMVGLIFNLIFAACIQSDDVVLGLMLGSPVLPAALLLIALWSCPESPRYYMRVGSRNYSPRKAYNALASIRGDCELLALKDIYLLHKTIEEEHRWQQQQQQQQPEREPHSKETPPSPSSTGGFFDLFTQTRLRNALISASTVALSQQLCGINVSAFYSGTLFLSFLRPGQDMRLVALGLSVGFGAVTFFCGLPAIKTIDTLGRRKLLISTLPLMCIFLAAAAYAFPIPYVKDGGNANTVRLVATLLYLHAAVYAPGLGPIPFTLASESFPLSHRELGCACVISVNLFFAGLLTIFFPRISDERALSPPGSLGLFSGLTLLAWVLVYFLVEETRELSLENLHGVFNVPKGEFVRLNGRRLVWLVRRYLLRDTRAPDPSVEQDEDEDQGYGESPSIVLERFAMAPARGAAGEGSSATVSRPGSAVDPGASVASVHGDSRARERVNGG